MFLRFLQSAGLVISPAEEVWYTVPAMDTMTPEQRHYAMSRIRSTENRPEREIRSQLHRFGFRFRKNYRRLAGSPDIVLPRYQAVIFVNGCFWHAHRNCSKFRLPRTNTEFWRNKLERNRRRDRETVEKLLAEGWRVAVVWECSITGRRRADKISNVAEWLAWWLEEDWGEPFVEV